MALTTFRHLSSVANTQIGGAGAAAKLYTINVNKGTATAVITVYHGTTTSDPVIAVIDGASKSYHDFCGMICPKGIFVDQTVAAADVTIVYG